MFRSPNFQAGMLFQDQQNIQDLLGKITVILLHYNTLLWQTKVFQIISS